MAKLKLTPEQRGEALFLLAHGHTVESAVKTLQEVHHPQLSLSAIHRAYFPRSGIYAISSLVGQPRKVLGSKYFQMIESKKDLSKKGKEVARRPESIARLGKQTAKLWESTEFRKRISEIARKTMLKMTRDPTFKAAHSRRMSQRYLDPAYAARHRVWSRKTMLKLKRDPEFLKKERAGLERFWEEMQRLRAIDRLAAEKPGGWEKAAGKEQKVLVPTYRPQIEEIIDLWRRVTAILTELSPIERFVLTSRLGIQMEHEKEVAREGSKLSRRERERILASALEWAKKHPKLKKLLGE